MRTTQHLSATRVTILAVLYLGILAGGAVFGHEITRALDLRIWSQTEPIMQKTIILALAAYVLTMALPFVPGVEIGLALIAVFGARIVPVVYLATLTALIVSYGVGRLTPQGWLATGFRKIGLSRAAALVNNMGPLDPVARRAHIEAFLPHVLRPWLLRHPAIALIVLLNMPGNSLVGGGGGIALVLGMSRLIPWPTYVLSVVFAVSPVPIAVLIGASMI